tara:strand:- start:1558 stop:1983 length:426 start_codon:yes stop_codon:yes gene_type:complete
MFDSLISKPIYRYFTIVFIIIIGIYITGKCLNYQSVVIEGLANHKRPNIVDKNYYSKLDQELKNLNENKKDTLLVSKYKSQFEDLLIELNENTHLELIQNINEYANSLVQNKNSSKYLEKINKYFTLNQALNSVMKHLDNQ